MIDQSLLSEFIVESNEHLDEMEMSLLRLEQMPDDKSIYDDIFRNIHSIKGGAQYLELEKVSGLTHCMEDLLVPLRDGERESSIEDVDLLIDGRDRLASLLKELEEHQVESSEISDLVNRLNVVLGSDDSGKNEIFQELIFIETESDEELFSVFIENIKAKHAALTVLVDAADQAIEGKYLDDCIDYLDNLRSSAKYMGYDVMTEFMADWLGSITDKISRDQDITAEFMRYRLDHLARAISGSSQIDEGQDEPLPVSQAEAVSSQDDEQTKEQEMNVTPGATELVTQSIEPEEESLDVDLELLPDFLVESYEHLEEVERLLLDLEQSPDDVDTMNGIFRLFHSIKGGAQFVGLVRVSKLAHRMEDYLDLLRSGKRQSSSEVVDLFIEGRDRLHQLLSELEEQEKEITPVNDLIAKIDEHISSDNVSADRPEAEEIISEPAPPSLPSAETTNNTSVAGELRDIVASDEEQDKELFDIYAKHHHEQLSLIQNGLQSAASSSNTELRDRLVEAVNKLRNSAAYMGYEDQVAFYDQWQQGIQQHLSDKDNEVAIDYGFMQPFIDRAVTIVPSSDLAISTVAELPSTTTSDDLRSSAVDEADEEELEEALLDRLSDALDGSVQLTDESETVETLHEVLEEILHGADVADDSDKPDVVTSTPAEESKIEDQTPIKKEAVKDTKPSRQGTAGKGGSAFKKSVRVDSEKIDSLMNQVGELVVDRSYFFQLFTEMRALQSYLKDSVGLGQKDLKQIRGYLFKLGEAIASLSRTSNELQEGVMKIRMLPIAQLFNRYPRLVHDLTRKSNKQVNLEVKGEDTELDKMVVEELSDPLVHMIRNAIDHGIESPKDRIKVGKPEAGTLLLEAYQESNHIVIEVTDDGKGIDTQSIRRKALNKGLYSEQELDRMSDKEIMWLVMSAGFSTADTISDTSGRGVGMDVVKKNIEKLNGTIEIDSILGEQTQVRLKIPLTLAIISALQIQVKGSLFTIPLANVEETLRISASETTLIEGTEVIHLRGQTLPIFRLASLFNLGQDKFEDEFFIVVASAGLQKVGLVVDELIGQSEVVIKPLVDYLQEKSGFSGATIMGDGRISLILDIYELINMTAQGQVKRHQNRMPVRQADEQQPPAQIH